MTNEPITLVVLGLEDAIRYIEQAAAGVIEMRFDDLRSSLARSLGAARRVAKDIDDDRLEEEAINREAEEFTAASQRQ